MTSNSIARRARRLGVAGGVGLAVLAACTEKSILAPPDGARCTVGTIAPALGKLDTLASETSAGRCERFSHAYRSMFPTESWTLRLEPASAYVIRLEPVEVTPGVFRFSGALAAYTRNAQGDPVIASLGLLAFEGQQVVGELLVASDSARELSLRVESLGLQGVGPYRLIVQRCPLTIVPLDSIVRGVRSNDGCLSRHTHSGARRLTFFATPIASPREVEFHAERASGTASLRARVAGPALDLMQTVERSLLLTTASAGSAQSLTAEIDTPGLYVHTIATHPDSAATIDVVAQSPVTLRQRTP
jgi:hypothetical protein